MIGRAPLEQGAVGLPVRQRTPLRAVGRRALYAIALLAIAAVIVFADRSGYRDSAHPDRPLSFLSAVYYSTVTLSTTGYGDIVPVSNLARLENTVIITPLRVLFLIALVGTTLGVLAEGARTSWRVGRWRTKVSGHAIVVGFGTQGRGAVRALRECGLPGKSIVVVDSARGAVHEANLDGLTGVLGDATRNHVLASAEAAKASRIVVAVPRDDTSVLVTLTARQLNPAAVIAVTIREAENEPLLRRSGADHVIVSAEAAGRLLGMTAVESAVGTLIAELLSDQRGLELTERPVTPEETGRPATATPGPVVAVVRDAAVRSPADPALGPLAPGDRLVVTGPPAPGTR